MFEVRDEVYGIKVILLRKILNHASVKERKTETQTKCIMNYFG